jgi:hypothetical protein
LSLDEEGSRQDAQPDRAHYHLRLT